MASRVHIIGASGRSGVALCRSLLADGEPFVPVVRDAARWAAAGIDAVARIADLTDPAPLRDALAGATHVVSCAHARHVPAVLAAAPADARLVFLGSTRKFTRWPDAHGDGVLAGEAAFLASGRRGVMLHPTMIYGAQGEDNVQRLAALLRRLPVVPLPDGGTALVQPIHQDDVTRAIRAALRHDWSGPHALVIAGPEPLRYADFVRAVAAAAGQRSPRIVALPARALVALAAVLRYVPFVAAHPCRGNSPAGGRQEFRRASHDGPAGRRAGFAGGRPGAHVHRKELIMPIINRIAEFHREMTEWRHDLHAHPELALQETRTSGVVQAKLKEFGVDEIITGMARTGVVGVIRGQGASDRAIGLRADMDALPILEETGAPYASQNQGVMHACGHDGHTTMLLGAAKYLAETRNFDGTVYVIFQPAEENLAGGEIMVKEGLFERCPMEMVFGMHNWPQMPAGSFAWRNGPVMAAVANIEITITGKGTHGAQPHFGTDPIVVASHIVTAFQSIVARTIEPVEGGVVTIGHINGGHTYNVIPETVRMLGTARWFDARVGDQLEDGVRRLATGIAESFGAKADVVFSRDYPATVNDPDATTLARRAAEAVAGEARVRHMAKPTMGGEDFSFMLNAKQGSYIMLGGGRGKDDAMVHHPRYDFNDEILPVGASYWVTLAEQLLARKD